MKLAKLESAKDLNTMCISEPNENKCDETINTAKEESSPAEMRNTKETIGSNTDIGSLTDFEDSKNF